MKTSEQSQTHLPLTSSAEDFPASHSASPESSKALTMLVTSGLRCYELLRLSGQAGSWVRMFLVSGITSTPWYLTWKPCPMNSCRLKLKLRRLGHLTEGQESGLWPTPNVCGLHNRKGASATSGDGLSTAVKHWPTPRASQRGDCPSERERNTPCLESAVKFATPQARDFQIGGQLNPTWVEWLMGYPIGWTDLNHSETPSCPKSSSGLDEG